MTQQYRCRSAMTSYQVPVPIGIRDRVDWGQALVHPSKTIHSAMGSRCSAGAGGELFCDDGGGARDGAGWAKSLANPVVSREHRATDGAIL